MNRAAWLFICGFIVGISGLACQEPAGTVVDKAMPTSKPATLPKMAKLSLAQLPPAVERPSDASDAEKIPDRAADIVARAERLIARGDYIQAINLLERARGFDPNSPRIRRGLGLAYAALGDRAKAEPHLLASDKTAPDHVRVQLVLGQYAIMQRQFDQAVVRYRLALLCSDADDDNPDTAETLLRLGDLLERRRCWTAAMECYERLTKLIASHGRVFSSRSLLAPLVSSPERCMVARGRLLLKLRQAEKAAVLLEHAYRRDKTDPDAGRLAVIALLEAGDFERPQAIIMEMLAEPARRREATASAVLWCRAKKSPSAPKSLLNRHLAGGGLDSDFVIAMAEVAAELGGTEDAADMLAKYLSKTSGDKAITLRLARLYAQTGNTSAAAGQLAALLNIQACDTSLVRREAEDLAGRGIKKGFVDELASGAPEKPELKPALLTVAAILADATRQGEKGIALLKQAIESDKKFWPAYEILADSYISGRRFEMLDDLVGQVNLAAGESWFRYYFTGMVQLNRGNVADAIDNLQLAHARMSRHVPTLLLMGRACLQAGQFRDAERFMMSASDLSPDDTAVTDELFNLYLTQRRNAEAGRVAMRFLQHDPENIDARTMMGRFYFLTGRIDRARKMLQSLLAEAPDNVKVRMFELSFELSGPLPSGEPIPSDQAASALKKIRHILSLDPQNIAANRLYASLLSNQGKDADAAEIWASLYRRRPADSLSASAWLDALLKAGLEKQAAEAAEEIASRESLAMPLRVMVLDTLVRLKRYESAEGFIERWMSEKPDKATLVMLRFQAMKTYKSARHYDKAHRLLDRWIASESDPVLLSSLRGEKLRIFGLARQYDEAIAYAGKWIRNEPTNSSPRTTLIAMLMEGEQYDKAHAIVDEWLGAGGDARMLDRLRSIKLIMYAREGLFDKLVQFEREWAGQSPGADVPLRLTCALLTENEKYDLALKVAEDLLKHQEKLPPDAPERVEKIFDAKKVIVHVMLLAGKKKQALALAREFVQTDPQKHQALRILMMALTFMEKQDESLEVAEKIYKLDPDDPGINNDLGYFWADRGINLYKAEAMIRKALAVRPDEAAFKDSFGWVLYKQGRFAEARTVFDNVLSTENGQHPVMLDHAGDTSWRLGIEAEAIRLWNRAVKEAKKEKKPDIDTKKVLSEALLKIKAARKGGKPPVAPLGKNVSAPKNK